MRVLKSIVAIIGIGFTPVPSTAAEPGQLELSDRVIRVTTELRNPGGLAIAGCSMCPDQLHDIAIGGKCLAGEDAELKGSTLVSGLGAEAYWCRFEQPENSAAPLLVTVVCVRNAR